MWCFHASCSFIHKAIMIFETIVLCVVELDFLYVQHSIEHATISQGYRRVIVVSTPVWTNLALYTLVLKVGSSSSYSLPCRLCPGTSRPSEYQRKRLSLSSFPWSNLTRANWTSPSPQTLSLAVDAHNLYVHIA